MEIYAITDVNGAIRYVGQSYDAAGRQREHWGARFTREIKLSEWLRTLDAPPSWRILAVVEDALADSTERSLIRAARAAAPDLNLNMRTRGGCPPATRVKLSEARKGHAFSPETRAKIGAAHRGRKQSPEAVEANRQRAKALWADPEWRETQLAIHRSAESRARKAAATSNQKHSDETKAKLAAAKRAQWADPEYRRKTTEAHIGKGPSAEVRAKANEANRAAWADPELRAQRSARIKTELNTPEAKEKLSESARKRWADPEFRAKMLAARQSSRARKKAT